MWDLSFLGFWCFRDDSWRCLPRISGLGLRGVGVQDLGLVVASSVQGSCVVLHAGFNFNSTWGLRQNPC